MRRSSSILMMTLLVMSLFMAGCSTLFDSRTPRVVETVKVPTTQPGQPAAPVTPAPAPDPKTPAVPSTPTFPGDMQALEAALAEPSPLTYKIMSIDTPKGTDLDAYLDLYLEQKGSPSRNEIWLLIFPNDNHNIRFVMGALLFEKKVSVQRMLEVVRGDYLPQARTGDPATGLATLIRSVNQSVK